MPKPSSSRPRMTSPRCVVTDNGAERAWNAKAQAFGPFSEATRYTERAAEKAFDSIPGAVGIFPCSVPRPIKRQAATRQAAKPRATPTPPDAASLLAALRQIEEEAVTASGMSHEDSLQDALRGLAETARAAIKGKPLPK